jgi:hypothetical protein
MNYSEHTKYIRDCENGNYVKNIINYINTVSETENISAALK